MIQLFKCRSHFVRAMFDLSKKPLKDNIGMNGLLVFFKQTEGLQLVTKG
jgi:hypothetical protein